jgi:hypothetical protein
VSDLTVLSWYFRGQTERDAMKFFKQKSQKIIRNSNPLHLEYQPRILDYSNLKGDHHEDWYVGYISMLYQVHRILTSNITRRHLCYVDIEVFMAYFEICPNIHLKEQRKTTKQIGISGTRI